MRNTDELIELRAERLELLSQLTKTNNANRQKINQRLMAVSRKIQKLSGMTVTPARNGEPDL